MLVIFFLPQESPSVSGPSHGFFGVCVNHLPTDPWPHRVPHLFLFSQGGALWPSSSVTAPFPHKQDTSQWPRLWRTISPFSLVSWQLLFPSHTSSSARLSRYFLCMISEIYFFLSGWQADTWIRSSFLWLSWHSISLCATSSHFQSLEIVVICWYHWFHLFIFHTFLQPLGSGLHPRSFVFGLETRLQSILQTLSVIFTLLSFTIQGETLSQYFITDLICSLHTKSMSILPG